MLVLRVKRWGDATWLYRERGTRQENWDYDVRLIHPAVNRYYHMSGPFHGLIIATLLDKTIIPIRNVFIEKIERDVVKNRVNFPHILGDWKFVDPEELKGIVDEVLEEYSWYIRGPSRLMVFDVKDDFFMKLECASTFCSGFTAYYKIMSLFFEKGFKISEEE